MLRDLSNVLIRLAPAPVVARVATSTALVRRGGAFAWLARDVELAGWLAANGAEVVAPADELPPGPHVEDGLAVCFWRHVEVEGRASPPEAREALRRLHAVLEGYPGELPPLASVVDECEEVAERLGVDRARASLARLRPAIEGLGRSARPLHGDASRSNLLRTPEGLLWTDFEDTCSGPLEWDLACMERSIDRDRSAGGDPFRELRELQGALWTALLAERHPELRADAEARLARIA